MRANLKGQKVEEALIASKLRETTKVFLHKLPRFMLHFMHKSALSVQFYQFQQHHQQQQQQQKAIPCIKLPPNKNTMLDDSQDHRQTTTRSTMTRKIVGMTANDNKMPTTNKIADE